MADEMITKGSFRTQYTRKNVVLESGGTIRPTKAFILAYIMVAPGGSFYFPPIFDTKILEDFESVKESPKGFKHIRRKVN